MPAIAILTKHNTQNANIKTHLETKDNQGPKTKHSNTVQLAKQNLLEHLSVTQIMVATKPKSLLHFHPGSSLVTKGCLPAKGIFEALFNIPFFILVTNITTR